MNILFVNRMAAMVRGGGETFDLQIAEELQRLGHEVSFLSGKPLWGRQRAGGRGQKGEKAEGRGLRGVVSRNSSSFILHPSSFKWHYIRSPYLGWFPWDKVRGGWRLRCLEFRIFEWLAVRWILRYGDKYDVIQICELPYVVSELKRKGFEKPVVMRLTGPNYEDVGGGVKKADGIIASGTSIATVMKTERPDAVNVPNCVDSGRFRPETFLRDEGGGMKDDVCGEIEDGGTCNAEEELGEEFAGHRQTTGDFGPEARDFRLKYDIGQDEFVLLYVARLQGFKDHDTLLRAFSLVLKDCGRSRLVLAGSGHMERPVKELIAELGIDDHVIMLNEVEYDGLPVVYAAADMMVISSIYESFCFAALEAMATELPVVTANNGWVPQLLGRGDAEQDALLPGYQEPDDEIQEYAGGLVVPKANPGRMAEAILQLAREPELRKRMGERNRRVIVEQYNWSKSAEILEALYESVLTTKGAKLREMGDWPDV